MDGPVASGKTTVGRLLAERLGWTFVDTGLMYRAAGLLAAESGVPLDDEQAIVRLIADAQMRVDGERVLLRDGRDIGPQLSASSAAVAASRVAELPGVRRTLVARQRQLGADSGGCMVMVGRDIGAVVLTDAPLKVYLDAPAEERARRRLRDEQARGRRVTLAQVRAELAERDRRDQERAASPLKPAPDAHVIQTGGLTAEEVVDAVLALAHGTRAS